ncbi:putative vacuolar import/degradation Vid27 [Helianthus debilis subsp. tardiflorus]
MKIIHKQTPINDLDSKLKAPKLKYSSVQNPNLKDAPKLYLHVGGNTPKAKWIVSDKITSYKLVKLSKTDNDDDDNDVSESDCGYWILKVGSKIRVRVSTDVQLKMFGDQQRVDFVDSGVWAMKFFRILSKPEVADDSVWEEEDGEVWRTPVNDLLEEFEEAANDGGIQSLAVGALDNSFSVNDSDVQVVKNFSHGIHGKGDYVKFDNGGSGPSGSNLNLQKALLTRGETNMLLMCPENEGKPHSTGVKEQER